MELLEQVSSFLSDQEIEDSSVLVAVSGGIDSTVLLHSLVELKEDFRLDLSVAHLDHCLRGKASSKDAELVKSKAESLGLQSWVEQRSAGRIAEEENLSLEEAARTVRYRFLSEAAKQWGADFIAVGHNKNDQAETILIHLIRGAGLEGLGGMKQVRGKYIRPLLNTTREKIKRYAQKEKLDYRFDKTNRDTSLLRNRVRRELIPKLEDDFNPRIVETLTRTGRIIKEAQSFIDRQVDRVSESVKLSGEPEEVCFGRDKLLGYHPYLQKKVIRGFIRAAKGDLKDVTSEHTQSVWEKLHNEPARTQLDLPEVTFSLKQDRACFTQTKPGSERVQSYRYRAEPESTVWVPEARTEISLEIEQERGEKNRNDFSSQSLIEFVDWGKVEQPLYVRNRKEGDSFVPLGMKGQKKLKDFFIDEKVPMDEREKIPLVCDSQGIVWIVGWRLDERYKLEDSTQKILKLKARKV